MSKKRIEKQRIYDEKYSIVPRDYKSRLEYMIDKYKVTPKQMDAIIERERNMKSNLYYNDYLIVLYEEPEGTPRPRFRYITKNNYMDAAISNPGFVHVYQPGAGDDFNYMHKLVEDELIELRKFIQTPCIVEIDCFSKIPSSYNVSDRFIAEYGLDWNIRKPDWDNIGKKYSDMFNSNIWLDDNLVVSGKVNKFYSELPRVEIYLKYLNCLQNKQQYDSVTKRKNYEDLGITYLDRKGEINIERK